MSELGGKDKQSPSLKARALRFLSMREYSRKSLGAKLEESVARSLKLQRTRAKSEEASSGSQESEDSDSANCIPAKPLSIQIEEVLNDFEARGWLSDQRFAEALVRRRSERFGTRKIQDELQQAGVDSSKTTELLRSLKETEFQRAHALWLRKFGIVAQEQKEKARQYRFLASKGFSSDVVSRVVTGRSN
jgi:regulatory protein